VTDPLDLGGLGDEGLGGILGVPGITGAGLTAAQMIRRVREVLRPGFSRFERSSFVPNGFRLSDLRTAVRGMLRDDGPEPFVTDGEITNWINEGYRDLAWRTRALTKTVTGTTGALGKINTPVDLIGIEELRLGPDGLVADIVYDDEEWNDEATAFDTPRTLARIAGTVIETRPAAVSAAYTMLYTASPAALADDNDQTVLAPPMQRKVVQYAAAQALLKTWDYPSSDRLMAMYSEGLPSGEGLAPNELTEENNPLGFRRVEDNEILDWLNEGITEVSWRTKSVRLEATGTTTNGEVPLPDRFLQNVYLKLSVALADGSYEVEFVENSKFQQFLDAASSLPHTIGRLYGGQVELYPHPADGTAWTWRYIAYGSQLVEGTDKTDIPFALQVRVVQFARAQALLAQGLPQDVQRAQQYIAQFAGGIPEAGAVFPMIEPANFDLVPMAGPWDTADARHI
jgi:hypothetical protein